MERRGFFGSLFAALLAPSLPKPKPAPKITKDVLQFGVITLTGLGIPGPGPEVRREMVKFAEAQKRFLAGRPIPPTRDKSAWDYMPGKES